jgi:hypothetical protein
MNRGYSIYYYIMIITYIFTMSTRQIPYSISKEMITLNDN